jgi:hypothetical protein
MKKIILCISFCALALSCAHLAGTNDETSIRTSAVIYEPDGKTPADSAIVRIFRADAMDGKYVSIQTTNANGRFSIAGLPGGAYTLWAQKDTLVTYQGSVLISPSDTLLRDDTLSCPSTITGIIGVQPQDDPRTVTIQVVGLDKYFDNTDRDGRFVMKNMAKGTYSLLLKSTEQHYTPTKVVISVGACMHAALPETLRLAYTGIPAVLGLAASYDTAAGVVRFSWRAADYRGFQNYCIFRDYFDSAAYGASPIAAPTDTFFLDTIFDTRSASGPFTSSDTGDYHFRYRAAIRNNASVIGPTYKYADIVAASSQKVKAVFSFSSRHCAKGYVTAAFSDSTAFGRVKLAGRASINDSVLIIARVASRTRTLARLEWNDEGGSAVRAVNLDTTQKSTADSISCAWKSLGTHELACAVTDKAGARWMDTVRIAVVRDAPKIELVLTDTSGTSVDSILGKTRRAFGDTITLHCTANDSFGSITSVRWGFGQGAEAAVKTMTFDTFAVAPDTTPSHFQMVTLVIDDDGNTASDSVSVELNLFAPATDRADFKSRRYQSCAVFKEKMWIFGGVGIAQEVPVTTAIPLNDTWVSDNGKSWNQIATGAPSRCGHSMVDFNGKLWLIGGFASSGRKYKNDVWCSADAVTWTCVTDSAAFSPRGFHSTVVFNNKMWVIGGLTRISLGGGIVTSPAADAWSSVDGVVWEKAVDTVAFPARCYHSSLVFADKMWVIGGRDTGYNSLNDVWYSSDGAAWTMATGDAGFSPRQGHSSLVYGGKMWVIGGYEVDASDATNDVWNSLDGKTWVQVSDWAGFTPRAFHSNLNFRNRMWVIAGMTGYSTLANDVWRSGGRGK